MTKPKFLSVICLFSFILITNLSAQDIVVQGGKLSGDVFWKGTVNVKGDVTVAKDGRLIIEAGTRVLFDAKSDVAKSGNDKTRSELIVRGTLIAQGNKNRKIIFSSSAPSQRMGDWYGIQFLHTKGGSKLDFCVVEFAYNGITVKNDNLQISNSEIRYNFNSGIRTEVKAKPKITQNIISENGYAAVVCELGSAPVLSDNLITQNPIGLVVLSLSQPNLGSLDQNNNYNPGRNRFSNNEEFDVYNHSTKQVYAQNNSWSGQTRSAILEKMYDKSDNSKYGTISFRPLFNVRQRESNLNQLLLLAQNSDAGTGEDQETQESEPAQLTEVPPEQTTSTDAENIPDTTSPNVLDESTANSETLLASTQPLEVPAAEDEPIVEAVVEPAPQIDYDQIFLEPFLDKRRKEFLRKEQFKLTGSLRQLLEPGQIRIKVIVGKNGEVLAATILKGINEMLDDAVLETVKRYRYKPGEVNGQIVRFSTNEVFRFK
jgi:TonB family protein